MSMYAFMWQVDMPYSIVSVLSNEYISDFILSLLYIDSGIYPLPVVCYLVHRANKNMPTSTVAISTYSNKISSFTITIYLVQQSTAFHLPAFGIQLMNLRMAIL